MDAEEGAGVAEDEGDGGVERGHLGGDERRVGPGLHHEAVERDGAEGDDGPLVAAGAPQDEREEEEEPEEGPHEAERVPHPLRDPAAVASGAVAVVVVHAEETFLLDGRLLHPRAAASPAAGDGRDASRSGGTGALGAGGEAGGGGGVPGRSPQRPRRGRGRGGVEGGGGRLVVPVVVARRLHVVGRPRRRRRRHARRHLRVRLGVPVRRRRLLLQHRGWLLWLCALQVVVE